MTIMLTKFQRLTPSGFNLEHLWMLISSSLSSNRVGQLYPWKDVHKREGEGRNERGRDRGREEIKRERVGERRKEERKGRGSPLCREKERGDGIIFRRHYFSLSRADERREKGGAGEGKELSLMRAHMRGGEKESGREGEKNFSPSGAHARVCEETRTLRDGKISVARGKEREEIRG